MGIRNTVGNLPFVRKLQDNYIINTTFLTRYFDLDNGKRMANPR